MVISTFNSINTLPSFHLIFQSAVSGLLLGGLYGLIGLGLGLSWGLLGQINLAHFAFVFLSAYLSYQISTTFAINPWWALLILPPAFFAVGAGLHALIRRFRMTPFNSLLLTFGLTVIVDALIQWVWTADFRKLESVYSNSKIEVAGIYFPYAESFSFIISLVCACAVYWVMKKTDIGKAVRAIAQDPQMSTAFGINQKFITTFLAGNCTALAAVAGICVSLIFTLNPAQLYTWIGVVFAVVMLGGLGSAFGPLLAGMLIGISESITMVFVAPSWAPIVSFTLLIGLLLFRPDKI